MGFFEERGCRGVANFYPVARGDLLIVVVLNSLLSGELTNNVLGDTGASFLGER